LLARLELQLRNLKRWREVQKSMASLKFNLDTKEQELAQANNKIFDLEQQLDKNNE
jgi:hypothetical protein